MAVNALRTVARRWPEIPPDPARVRLAYGPLADELVIHFGGEAVPDVVDPMDAPAPGWLSVLLAEGPDETAGDEVIGLQVYPLLAGAATERPAWRVLAVGAPGPPATEEQRAAVADLIAVAARAWPRRSAGQ